MITKSYFKLVKVSYADSDYFHVTNVSDQIGTLTLNGTNNLGKNLEYSTDGVNWTTADSNAPFSLNVPAGANVYMRGTNTSMNGNMYPMFNMDVDYTVGGNILSLLNKTNYATITTVPSSVSEGTFKYTFYNQTHLKDLTNLNLGSLNTIYQNAFIAMFQGCTQIRVGLDLSGITSAAFDLMCSSMYNGCSNLQIAYMCNTTNIDSNAPYRNFLTGTNTNGLLYKPAGMTLPSNMGKPSGWTTQDY